MALDPNRSYGVASWFLAISRIPGVVNHSSESSISHHIKLAEPQELSYYGKASQLTGQAPVGHLIAMLPLEILYATARLLHPFRWYDIEER